MVSATIALGSRSTGAGSPPTPPALRRGVRHARAEGLRECCDVAPRVEPTRAQKHPPKKAQAGRSGVLRMSRRAITDCEKALITGEPVHWMKPEEWARRPLKATLAVSSCSM